MQRIEGLMGRKKRGEAIQMCTRPLSDWPKVEAMELRLGNKRDGEDHKGE